MGESTRHKIHLPEGYATDSLSCAACRREPALLRHQLLSRHRDNNALYAGNEAFVGF
jgi:hypothetical protein